MRLRPIPTSLAVALVALVALAAGADPLPRHVYVDGLSEGDVSLVVSGPAGDPVGVVANGDVIAPPRGGARREDEALLSSAPDPSEASAPATEMRPDRLTGTVSATDYYEAFTPAIAPYKRSIAYDAIRLDGDGTPVLVVADTTRMPVPVVGTNPRAAGPRDAFWGTAMVDFRRGTSVAIPSVAGDARILHVRSEPAIDFALETDSAGNFYAHALEPGAGIVRLTYLTDAPRGFFRRPIPSQRTDALASHVPPVPDAVRERGLRFAAELGLAPGTPVEQTLDVLVGHFRSFVEADAIPSATGDVYLDLARGRVGVCRHRAYAFVVTAQSLSLPARYVQNEAHAWVEVELRDGFLRIDLGGSASGVNAHGLQDRPKHEIEAADPFPQPEIYVRDYLERGVAPEEEPQSSSEGGGARTTSSATEGTSGGDPASGMSGTHEASGPGAASAAEASARATMDPSSTTQNGSEDEVTAGDDDASEDARLASSLRLDDAEHRVYRGQMLDLGGALADENGRPIASGRIEVRLDGGRLLGVALSGVDGRFGVSLGIPPDLGVGRHAMRVLYVGDATHRPAIAP